MDRFLLAINPMRPKHPHYIIDTVEDVFWMIYFVDKDTIELIIQKKDNSSGEYDASKKQAIRWYTSVINLQITG